MCVNIMEDNGERGSLTESSITTAMSIACREAESGYSFSHCQFYMLLECTQCNNTLKLQTQNVGYCERIK